MNLRNTLIGILVLPASILLLFSCSLESKTQQSFLIHTDSIQAPDTVYAGVAFDIKLFGIVGPNGCYSLQKIYHYQNLENEVFIEPWGMYNYDGTPCPTVIIQMNETVGITIPASGKYTLKVLRPFDNSLDKAITVK